MTQNKKLHDEIAIVAYTLFQNSGRLHGYDVENWLEAEKMVMEAYAKGVETDAKKPSKTKAKKTK
jgi:hypothetical protein